jgi:hypothetical protein
MLQPSFDEPDLQCDVNGSRIGIAVKRVKSLATFRRRISEGADQILRSGISGVVLVDVSQSLNRSNFRLPRSLTDAEFDGHARRIVAKIRSRFEKPLLQSVEGKHVLGVILLDHQVREHGARGWELTMNIADLPLVRYNERRQRQFRLLVDKLAGAVLRPGSHLVNCASISPAAIEAV